MATAIFIIIELNWCITVGRYILYYNISISMNIYILFIIILYYHLNYQGSNTITVGLLADSVDSVVFVSCRILWDLGVIKLNVFCL